MYVVDDVFFHFRDDTVCFDEFVAVDNGCCRVKHLNGFNVVALFVHSVHPLWLFFYLNPTRP